MRARKPSRSVLGYLAKGEYVVLEMKQHWARVMPSIASVLVGFILVVVAGLSAPAWMGWMSNAAWWIWLVLFVHFLWRVVEWKDETFVVTNRRLILVHGLFVRKVAMMPLSKITDMSYNRSPVARILGYGTFVLESAGQDQALSEVNFVRDPDARYREICGLIFHDDSPRPPADVDQYLEDETVADDRVHLHDDPYDEPVYSDFYGAGDDPDDGYSPEESPRHADEAEDFDWTPGASQSTHPGRFGSPHDADGPSQNDWRSADFDGWEGSPRVRRRGQVDPSDITDPFGIGKEEVTKNSRSVKSDAHHTYTEATHTVGDPADGHDSAWTISREHATRPQSVNRSRDLDNPSKLRDDR